MCLVNVKIKRFSSDDRAGDNGVTHGPLSSSPAASHTSFPADRAIGAKMPA